MVLIWPFLGAHMLMGASNDANQEVNMEDFFLRKKLDILLI